MISRSSIFTLLFWMGSVFLLSPPITLAQPIDLEDHFGNTNDIQIPEYDPTGSPSTGTLMAAALESAGYKALEIVNTQMSSTLMWLAVLIYVTSCIYVIINYTVFQDTRGVLWLFLGPGLYFFLTTSTVTSGGAEWQYADWRQNEEIEGLLAENVSAEVPWFFDAYNQLLSNTFSQLSFIILSNDLREQLSFTVRQQMMDKLLSTQVLSPELQSFMNYNLAACSEELGAARMVAQGRRDPSFQNSIEYQTAVREFGQGNSALWNQPNKTIPPGPVMSYLRDRVFPMATSSLGTLEGGDIYSECIQESLVGKDPNNILGRPVSCSDMWCWMALGLHEEVLRASDTYEDELMPSDERLKQQLWADLAAKLTTPGELGEGSNAPIADGIVEPSLIPTLIGGYLLRRQMAQGGHAEGIKHFGEKAGVYAQPGGFNIQTMTPEQREQYGAWILEDQLTSKYKFELFSMAMMLPYLQGCILYILSWSYPLFCLMVLIPGQARGVFIWVGMWTWVKIWDVGWALVMVIDDLLWDFMPRSGALDVAVDPNNGPLSMLDAAFADDPVYNLSMYYASIGVLMTSVPLISAQFLLGSKAVIASNLLDGMNRIAQEHGDAGYRTKGMRHSTAMQAIRERNNAWSMDEMFHTMSADQLREAGISDVPVEMVNLAEQLEAQADHAQSRAQDYVGAGQALATVGGVATGLGAASTASGAKAWLEGVKRQKGFVGFVASAALRSGVYLGSKTSAAGFDFMEAGRALERQSRIMRVSAMQIRESARLIAIGEDPGELNLQPLKALAERGRSGGWIRPSATDLIYSETETLKQDYQMYLDGIEAELATKLPSRILEGWRLSP